MPDSKKKKVSASPPRPLKRFLENQFTKSITEFKSVSFCVFFSPFFLFTGKKNFIKSLAFFDLTAFLLLSSFQNTKNGNLKEPSFQSRNSFWFATLSFIREGI